MCSPVSSSSSSSAATTSSARRPEVPVTGVKRERKCIDLTGDEEVLIPSAIHSLASTPSVKSEAPVSRRKMKFTHQTSSAKGQSPSALKKEAMKQEAVEEFQRTRGAFGQDEIERFDDASFSAPPSIEKLPPLEPSSSVEELSLPQKPPAPPTPPKRGAMSRITHEVAANQEELNVFDYSNSL